MAQRISSSLGSGFDSSSAVPTSIIAGVQNPHWRPCSCLKPCCTDDSAPSCLRPSTVVSSRPLACTANSVHAFTGLPSSSTVHTPQLVVSHPMCVPVRPSSRRMKSARSMRGSTSALCSLPLTVTVICTDASLGLSRRGRCGDIHGRLQAALHEHVDDVSLVLRASADVVVWICRRCGQPTGFAEHLGARLRPDEHLLSVDGLDVRRADGGQRDAGG